MKLRSLFPRLSCSLFTFFNLDRPNLMTMSGDFRRGSLSTFESVSSDAELSLNADWLRPYLMKDELMVLRLSLDSTSSLRSSMPCLFVMNSNLLGSSLKILRLLSSFSGAKIEEDTNAQLQRNTSALKVQSAIYD